MLRRQCIGVPGTGFYKGPSTVCNARTLRVTIEPGFGLQSRSGCFSEEMAERAQAEDVPELLPLGAPQRRVLVATRGGFFGRGWLNRGDRAEQCERACLRDPGCWGYEVRSAGGFSYAPL